MGAIGASGPGAAAGGGAASFAVPASSRRLPSLHTTIVHSRSRSISAVATQNVLEPCWPTSGGQAAGGRPAAGTAPWPA